MIRPRTTVRLCIVSAGAAFGVAPECLYAQDKRPAVSHARFAAIGLARAAGHSYSKIAREIGRNHAVVIYGVNRATALRAADSSYDLAYTRAALLASAGPVPCDPGAAAAELTP